MTRATDEHFFRRRISGRVGATLAVLLTAVSLLTAPTASGDTASDADAAAAATADASADASATANAGTAADADAAVAAAVSAAAADKGVFAIGDSFASGQGSPDYGGTFAASQTCGRSYRSWPYLLADDTPGLRWVDSAACSAARSNAVYSWFKGQQPQGLALAGEAADVDLVTVMIGGNDIGFADVVGNCVLSDCTDGTVADASERIEAILPQTLATAYADIRAAAPEARIVVVGYPRLVPENGSLGVTLRCLWMSNAERRQLGDMTETLDRTIEAAAVAAGFDYVSTLDAFRGHEMCTQQPHVYPIGPEFLVGPGYRFMGHPMPAGQVDIENEVRAYMSRVGII